MRTLYLALALLGTALPYLFFVRFVADVGPSPGAFLAATVANDASAGLVADLTVATLAFWAGSWAEARRLGMRRWWIYPAVTLAIGLSCALPLFLWARAGRLEERAG